MQFRRKVGNLSMAGRAYDRILNIPKLMGLKLLPRKHQLQIDPDEHDKSELLLKFKEPESKQKVAVKVLSTRKSAFELQVSRSHRERMSCHKQKNPPPGAYNPRYFETKLNFQMRRVSRFPSEHSVTQSRLRTAVQNTRVKHSIRMHTTQPKGSSFTF